MTNNPATWHLEEEKISEIGVHGEYAFLWPWKLNGICITFPFRKQALNNIWITWLPGWRVSYCYKRKQDVLITCIMFMLNSRAKRMETSRHTCLTETPTLFSSFVVFVEDLVFHLLNISDFYASEKYDCVHRNKWQKLKVLFTPRETSHKNILSAVDCNVRLNSLTQRISAAEERELSAS